MTNPNTNENYLREHYENWLDDTAMTIAEGEDFDEALQRLTDKIAEDMAIVPTDPDDQYEDETSDYFLLNKLLNEIISETNRITDTATQIVASWQASAESVRGTPTFDDFMDGYELCILKGGDGRWDTVDTLAEETAASWIPEDRDDLWELLTAEVTKLMTPWIQAQEWEHTNY